MKTLTLHHYTAAAESHLGSILSSGLITPTESNVSGRRPHAGPDVVWLTTADDLTPDRIGSGLAAGHGLYPAKASVRITVALPVRDVHRWREWAAARGAAPDWIRTLSAAGGSGTWRVTSRPIPRSEWVEVIDTTTGQPINWTGQVAA